MVGFEKALRAVKVIKDQIQYRSQSLLNLARGYLSTTMAQIMNYLSLIYSKYFAQQLLFQLMAVNPIELLPTCFFEVKCE